MASTDNPIVSQVTQVIEEATYGVTLPATKRYQGFSVNLKAANEASLVRPEGYKHPTGVIPTKEWSEGDVMLQADFNAMPFALAMAFKKNVTPAVVGTLGRLWVFDPVAFGCGDDVNSITIERGNCVRSRKASGHAMTEYGMSLSRSDISFSGKVMGQRLVDDSGLSTNELQTITVTGTPTGGTITINWNNGLSAGSTAAIAYNATAATVQAAVDAAAVFSGSGNVLVAGGPWPGTPITFLFKNKYGQSNVALMSSTNALTGGTSPNTTIVETTPGSAPTEIPNVLMNPNGFDIWIDDTAAALGTTLAARGFGFNWKATNLRVPDWPIGTANQSFAAMVEAVPSHTVDLTLGNNTEGMALLSNYRAGTPKFIRIKGVGPLIETSVNYFYQLDMCLLLNKTVEYTDQDNAVVAAKWSGELAYDTTWGRAFRVSVQNAKPTL